jgi:hypothetical protein
MYMLERASNHHCRDDLKCPFIDGVTSICGASLSSMIVGPHNRREYCLSENYDNCPLFLAKVMRRK